MKRLDRLSAKTYMIISMSFFFVVGLTLGILFDKIPIFICTWFPLGFGAGRILQKKYAPDEFKESQKELKPVQKKTKIATVIGLSSLAVFGAVAFAIYKLWNDLVSYFS